MADNESSTLPRRQLGRYVRDGRLASNLTIAEAARLMEWSEARLQRLETGNLPPDKIRTIDIRELCRLYSFDDTLTSALIGLAQQVDAKSWFHEFGDLIPEDFDLYVGLESSARLLISVQPVLIPGLLQTADYARVLIRESYPGASESEIERRVELKMQRQKVITRKSHPVNLEVVIHEAALRRVIGSQRIMNAQLRHLAEVGKLPNVTILILPDSAGVPGGSAIGPYIILDFGQDKNGQPIEPSMVYVEGFVGDVYLEKPAVVARYHEAYAMVRRAALDEVSSRNLLRQAAKGV